ncbi:MAG: ABC transporter ATP-binding protein [Sedimentisphaerales bacterium]|nr:ABC transporter ATP-binding protein [Sedimentisphaerales bacterium]
MDMIEVKNVSFRYPQQEVLRDITFRIAPGRFLAIAGPNGAGKTTLLRLLNGMLKPTKGGITIDGEPMSRYNPRRLAHKIAVVRQDVLPSFAYSVYETIIMGRTCHFGPMGFESEADQQAVQAAMEATETTQFASRRLTQLSGGERQRVYIARALAQDTPILLLDEPTSFLDMRHQVAVFDLLKGLQKQRGITIIAITHNLNLAGQYCEEMLLLGPPGQYTIGPVRNILTAATMERFFHVKILQGHIGDVNFLLPVGRPNCDTGR